MLTFYDDSKCDVTHDLEEFPWPWEDDSVSEIEDHSYSGTSWC